MTHTVQVGRYTVLMDAEDVHLLNGARLSVIAVGSHTKNHYVTLRDAPNKYIGLLHRKILALTNRRVLVDHINHNGLDNRKANLRICSHADNLKNKRGSANRKHKLPKGVQMKRGRYVAWLQANNVRFGGPERDSPQEAAKDYAELSARHHGEFGCLV